MELNLKTLRSYQKKFEKDQRNLLAMNAVGRAEIQDLAINRDLIKEHDFTFSHEIEMSPDTTAQQKVGVCWMFACFNLLRSVIQKKLNVEKFEFSGPHLMFWDKMEKANYFLEKIIELRDKEYSERTLKELLKNPIADGGDWYMFVNLVKKYGVVPQATMHHSSYSKESESYNKIFNLKLRQFASILRRMHQEKKSIELIQKKKAEFIEEIYKMLVICFGTPPDKFNWSYRNKENEFFREVNITPQKFYEKYVGLDLDEYYTIWSSPLDDTPYNQTFSFEHSRNMIGGNSHLTLNVEFDQLKELTLNLLKDNEPCIFACEVGKDSLRKEGLMIKNLYNYDLIFNTDFNMNKKERLETGESSVSHCMLIVGVDLIKGIPHKWKVENSWGNEVGKKGFFIMSDDWFEEHTYQIVVHQSRLTPEMKKNLKKKVKILPLWHPMA